MDDHRGNDGYRELQAAIFQQSIDDMRDSLRFLRYIERNYPNVSSQKAGAITENLEMIKDIEGFADSPWCEAICPIDVKDFKAGIARLKAKSGMQGKYSLDTTYKQRLFRELKSRNITNKWLHTITRLSYLKILHVEMEGFEGDVSKDTLMKICKAINISPIYIAIGGHKETYLQWEMRKNDKVQNHNISQKH